MDRGTMDDFKIKKRSNTNTSTVLLPSVLDETAVLVATSIRNLPTAALLESTKQTGFFRGTMKRTILLLFTTIALLHFSVSADENATDPCLVCETDADCISFGSLCLNQQCTEGNNLLLGTTCSCRTSTDCTSGRCDGLIFATCKDLLPDGSLCNEDSDCASGMCNFRFVCATPASPSPTPATMIDDGDDDETDLFAMIGSILILLFLGLGCAACCCLEQCRECRTSCFDCCKSTMECCALCGYCCGTCASA